MILMPALPETRGSFLTSPLAPRGELLSQGWTLSPRGNVHPFVHLGRG
jgi:hypothetical protein